MGFRVWGSRFRVWASASCSFVAGLLRNFSTKFLQDGVHSYPEAPRALIARLLGPKALLYKGFGPFSAFRVITTTSRTDSNPKP